MRSHKSSQAIGYNATNTFTISFTQNEWKQYSLPKNIL
jgi:hypothetical protein